MSTADASTLLESSVKIIGVVVGLITLILLYRQVRLQAQQTQAQNKILTAQLLKDRFDMYRTTSLPVSSEELAEFHRMPEDYISLKFYHARYKENDEASIRYISYSHIYEYLAFTHQLRELGLPDPLGSHWLELWVSELKNQLEFLDVHNSYRGYYKAFAKFVDDAPTKSI